MLARQGRRRPTAMAVETHLCLTPALTRVALCGLGPIPVSDPNVSEPSFKTRTSGGLLSRVFPCALQETVEGHI